jgi:hypothetical protein
MNHNLKKQKDRIDGNPVLRKIYELSSLRLGDKRVIIRHVESRQLAPGLYEWRLYENESDPKPVERLTLDVSLSGMLTISDDVETEFRRDLGHATQSQGTFPISISRLRRTTPPITDGPSPLNTIDLAP